MISQTRGNITNRQNQIEIQIKRERKFCLNTEGLFNVDH